VPTSRICMECWSRSRTSTTDLRVRRPSSARRPRGSRHRRSRRPHTVRLRTRSRTGTRSATRKATRRFRLR
jgi:hypothetical protein